MPCPTDRLAKNSIVVTRNMDIVRLDAFTLAGDAWHACMPISISALPEEDTVVTACTMHEWHYCGPSSENITCGYCGMHIGCRVRLCRFMRKCRRCGVTHDRSRAPNDGPLTINQLIHDAAHVGAYLANSHFPSVAFPRRRSLRELPLDVLISHIVALVDVLEARPSHPMPDITDRTGLDNDDAFGDVMD